MMAMARLAAISLATLALPSLAPAFVMIDDFTQGPFEKTYTFAFGNETHERLNLDRTHVALGERRTNFSVGGNLNNRPVTLRIGDGEAKVTTDTNDISTRWNMSWGNSDLNTIDLSKETEIWMDVYTENPAGRLADIWALNVRDRNGVDGGTPNWLFRPGGIRFRKQDFNPRLDWSQIEYMSFDQRYSTDVGPHPLTYSVTRIYAVPEPGTFLLVVGAAGVLARRRSSH